jgi:peptide/nickel transport system permease protein
MSYETDKIDVKKASRTEQKERIGRMWRRFKQNTLSVVGLGIVGIVVAVAIFAPVIAPYPASATTGDIIFERMSQGPSLQHPMGTDPLGRDIFSRVLFGARYALLMAVTVLSIVCTVGVLTGLFAGFVGGWIGDTIMRIADIFVSVPPILMAIAVTAILGPSLSNAMVAIAFSWWPWYTRLTQSEVISLKEEEFVEASVALGANWYHIMFKELLPNLVSVITVKLTLDVGFVILTGAALAFLGLGAQPPTPTWGAMISQGRENVTTMWWIATFPGLAISFTVLGFNLLGDGLRDMLDIEEVQR